MKNGDKVKVHYTGTLDDGTTFDSSEGREPLEFTIGGMQVIRGFEDGIRDMKLNEEKTIKINAKNAYGVRDERLTAKLPRDRFPPQIDVGGRLIMKGPQGEKLQAIVTEVGNETVKIDLNHPLAGKDLTFKVKVVAIN